MNHEEYLALQRVERKHWFYVGKRELVRWWIEKLKGRLGSGDAILDAGAGTGEFVKELQAAYAGTGCTIIGIEYAEVGREIARETNNIELRPGSILDLPLETGSMTASFAMDVLEHVEDDAKALSAPPRVTKPGGIVLINVPAFNSLWSEWDVSLGHYRRYSKRMFRKILTPHVRSGNIKVHYFGYINSFAFPGVLAYRMLGRLVKLKTRAEDKVPSTAVNNLLRTLFVAPAKWKWFAAPFGVSLFCVIEKKSS